MEGCALILKDKTINEEPVLSFIQSCLNQIDGYPGVNDALAAADLANTGADMKARISANRSFDGLHELQIDYTSGELRHVCEIVINTLRTGEDLSTVLGLDNSEAISLLKDI